MEASKEDKSIADICKVQEDQQDHLLSMQNVVGVAVSHKVKHDNDTGDDCLTVFVSQKLDKSLLRSDDLVPATVGKFKTDVVESGDIFALPLHATKMQRVSRPGWQGDFANDVENMQDFPDEITVIEPEEEEVGIQLLRQRVRPVEGGYSVGHFRITAGTYATAVYDARPFPGVPGKYYVLSNNHVLANSNNARIGDPILQPGPIDGGRHPRDTIARLSRFVPIRFGGPANLVDAAIAEGEFHVLDREVYWMGYVQGVQAATRRSICQKTGRTTNRTTGRVTSVNGTVNVNYGGGRVARFIRQIITTNMSAGGDSGSLLCDMKANAVGLLFAGSSAITIHNDIRYVQSLLGIRIV